MKLQKIESAEVYPSAEEFAFSGNRVQGARVGRLANMLLVESPRRYKLFTEGRDELYILSGSGHFKWARGETPFAAGDCFAAENVGEYELNGACTFIVARK